MKHPTVLLRISLFVAGKHWKVPGPVDGSHWDGWHGGVVVVTKNVTCSQLQLF